MAINYDSLPSSKPNSYVPAGFYKATIIKAEMKRSQNTGNEYLSIQYDLTNDAGQSGKLFDILMESEKEFLRYKLQRFLTALNLNLTGAFELKDLCKLINNKKLIVDVQVEDDDKYGKRNTVNSFEHEIYYAPSEWASLTGVAEMSAIDAVEDPEPINASDAADADESY